MKLRKFMLSLAAMTALLVGAQNQGFQDGIEYFKVDQLDNAKEILTKTLNDAETDRALALYYIGAIALEEGDVAAAKAAFDEGIVLDPKNGLNFVGLGAIDLKNGNPKAAEQNFKAATKAQNKAFIRVAIARAYYKADPVAYQKEYNKFMEQATDKDKKEPAIYILRGDVLRDKAIAAGESDANAIGEAAAMYNQAIYFSPESPEAYVKYSRVFAQANPQYAIEKLIELNRIAPNSAMAQRELAERYYDNDQWTRAAEQYGKYISNPNSFIKDKERYAVLLYFGEKYDESLAITREILATNPESLQMMRMLFLNLEKSGDLEGAKAAAEAFFATELPEGVKFTANDYTTYANILSSLKDHDGEITARAKAAEANPEKPELLKDLAVACSNAGTEAYKIDSIAQANVYYRSALEAMNKFMEVGDYKTNDFVTLSSYYQNVASSSPVDSPERLEAITKAMETIDKVIERVPDNYIPRRNKARMSIVKNGGEPSEESVQYYNEMIQVLDADPENKTKRKDTYIEAYNMIAKYYINLKDLEGAIATYELYLAIDPENQALSDYLETLKKSRK